MSASPYCNLLRKGDTVQLAKSGRRGEVSMQPRECSTMVNVRLEGIHSTRYFRISDLRFVCNGKAEDVPPYDGELPAKFHNPAPPPPRPRRPENQLRDLIEARQRLTRELGKYEELIFALLTAAADRANVSELQNETAPASSSERRSA
jgi:hypothetical protein